MTKSTICQFPLCSFAQLGNCNTIPPVIISTTLQTSANLCNEVLCSTLTGKNRWITTDRARRNHASNSVWKWCFSPLRPRTHHLPPLMTTPIHPLQCDEAARMFQVAVLMPKKHKTLLLHRVCLSRYSVNQCFSTFVRPWPGKFYFHKKMAWSQQIY